MTELKLNYEQRLQREEGGEETATPCLRSRQEVRQKLIELGLAKDPEDFGRHKRQPRQRRRSEDETQLEVLEGGISVMKKTPRGKRRVNRREGSSSPELHFDTTEHFSEEEYRVSGKN